MSAGEVRSALGLTADTLHEAAREIRTDVSATDRWADEDVPFVLAVAAWLNACALVLEVSPSATKANALAVARAYLGETA